MKNEMISKDIRDFLKTVTYDFDDLQPIEHQKIYEFTLLCSLFEVRCLENRKETNTNEQIKGYVNNLSNEKINSYEIIDVIEYFQARYKDNISLYNKLKVNDKKNPEAIKMLRDDSISIKEKIIGCLVIIYRYRNNFFHGTKWKSEFRDQQNNFNNSIKLLKQLIEPL